MGVWRIIRRPDPHYIYYEEALEAYETRAEAIEHADRANGYLTPSGKRKAKIKRRKFKEYIIRYDRENESLRRPPRGGQLPTVSGGLPGLGKRR